ncbi:MAG TPA: hypothetical protein VIX83_12615 [Candidatus Cybelea sp.]
MTLTSKLAASASFAASLALGACGGGQSSMGTMPVASSPMHAVSAQPLDRNGGGCQNDGDLHVNPCRIRFDANHLGPMDVVVDNGGGNDRDRGRGGPGQQIRESDDCASRDIATLTRDSNHVYTVAAGTVSGSCTANFTDDNRRNRDGNRGQNGNLRVVNAL